MQARSIATYLPTTLAVCCLFALALPKPVVAQIKSQTSQTISYQIEAGSLDSALNKFATQSKLQVVYSPELVTGKSSSGLSGHYSPQQALGLLLKGKGISWDAVNPSMYVLRQAPGTKTQTGQQATSKVPSAGAAVEGRGNKVQDLDKMVVVGSRLGTSPYEALSMAKVIGRDEIERSGASNIAQVLSYLPEVSVSNAGDTGTGTVGGSLNGRDIGFSTVQLRGLPQGTTLVLINGRRAGSSASGYDADMFDLSTIPLGMVERIEVLPMGSSAIYGGDGLAGVINIVLRRDAEGTEMFIRNMNADGYAETTGGITFGKAWSRGRMMSTITWRKAGTLNSDERDITADADYRRFGGQDRRQPFSYPGNVYSFDGCGTRGDFGYICFVPIEERGNLPGLDAPFASIPDGQNGQGLTPQEFIDSSGDLNLQTERQRLVSPTEQYGFGLNASFDLSEQAELFTEWNVSKRTVDASEVALYMTTGEYGFTGSIVSALNPFNPFGVDVGIDYKFYETGIFQKYTQTYWRGLVGVRKEGKKFSWEATVWQSREWSDTGDVGYFNDELVQSHLDSTDPSTALNPFAADGTSPASISLLRGMINPASDGFATTIQGFNAFVKGGFEVFGATTQVLLGTEYERTTLDWNSSSGAFTAVDGADDRQAVFSEARVPLLVSEDGSWNRLVANGALRYESTGRSQGNALTKAFGLEYRPNQKLSLRANFGTAFKPMNLFSSVYDTQTYNTTVADPQFEGQYFNVPVVSFGGTPEGLKPETSETLSFALVYAPVTDTKLSINYWESKLRNRLTSLRADVLVQNELGFPGRVTRDQVTGQILQIDARPVNISSTDNAGVDLVAETTWSTRFGDLAPSIAASYVYKYDEKLTPDSAVENNVARWSPYGWSPRWKIVPRVGWYWRDLVSATLTGRYVSKYEDPAPLTSGDQIGTTRRLGGMWQLDLNMEADVSRWMASNLGPFQQIRVSIGAVNLFNRLPDYCNTCASFGGVGYDANQYDIMGRRVYAELKIGF